MPPRRPLTQHHNVMAKTAVSAALALTPLVVFPLLPEPWEVAKLAFLLVCTVVAALAWSWSYWRSSIKECRLNYIDLALLVFGLIGFIGLLSAPWWRGAFWGGAGYVNDSFMATMIFLALFFIATRLNFTRQELAGVIAAVAGVWFVVLLFQLFQFTHIYPLGFDASQNPGFTLTGNSLRSLLMISVFAMVLGAASWPAVKNHAVQRLIIALIVLAGVVLALVDDPLSWYFLLISSFLGLLLSGLTSRPGKTRLALGLVLVFGILGLVLPIGSDTKLTPHDFVLPLRESAQISWSALRHSPVWGTGPGTFYYDFVSYRPDSVNALPLWPYRFIKAANQWWQWLATTGILGTLALALAILLVVATVFRIRRKIKNKAMGLTALLFFSMAVAWGFFAPFTITSMTIFWTAFIIVSAWLKLEGAKLPGWTWKSPRLTKDVGLVVAVVLSLSAMCMVGRITLAQIYFEKAQRLGTKNATNAQIQKSLDQARFFDQSSPDTALATAEQQIAAVRELAMSGQATSGQLAAQIRSALKYADQSMSVDPNNPARIEAVISIYQKLSEFVFDADQGASQLYDRLIRLEPKNPHNYFGAGQTLLVTANRLKVEAGSLTGEAAKKTRLAESDQALNSAITDLQSALSLKPDYYDAEFRLALAQEMQGQAVAARDRLANLVTRQSQNPELWYELGRLQMITEQKTAAMNSFQQAIMLFPNHSNSHFQLGVLLAEQGKKDEAKREFEIVLGLNPGNADVQKKLDELNK